MISTSAIAAVGAGGAVGAVLRYLANISAVQLFGHDYPFSTVFVNIAGSFAMGVCIALFAHGWNASDTTKMFLTTGLLGAFTTFSTFSLNFITLWERGEVISAVLYMLVSVVMAILALLAGMMIVRGFAA